MSVIEIKADQTTTVVARTADTQWIVNTNVNVAIDALGIDASGAFAGRSFTINGSLNVTNATAMTLGDASLADSKSYFKVGDVGTFMSSGNGIVAASGGVIFENAGTFSADATALELDGDGNSFKNSASETGPGKFTSNNGKGLVTAGEGDRILNTGGGMISTKLDAITSTGDGTWITNEGGAQITSVSGSAIVASGDWDKIYSVSKISADKDVIVSTGNNTKITNAGDSSLSSNNGRGIVSGGNGATITNQAVISTKLDAIVSSGDNAKITNTATLGSWTGAGILSTGDGALITNTTTVQAGTVGISSTGNHAIIKNSGNINADGVGIVVAGNDAVVLTTSQVASRIALEISGNGASVTNENELSGSSKDDATIVITATGKTHFTNDGAVSASGSGIVITAGNGVEIINNASSLYGIVDLGGGNDVFKSSVTGVVSGAVIGGAGNDRITNTGVFEYDVVLGAGNDVFTALKGEVRGKVIGGKGDDLYILGTDPDIREAKGGGTDSVESKFTYTLGANLENLTLLGKGKMDAIGNSDANRIEGNGGNNHLTGLGGKDVFVFEGGFRQDIVTDFVDHKDRIDLSGYDGVSKFSDLKGKIADSGDDVVITLDGHDRLTIEGEHKSHLSAADFIF